MCCMEKGNLTPEPLPMRNGVNFIQVLFSSSIEFDKPLI